MDKSDPRYIAAKKRFYTWFYAIKFSVLLLSGIVFYLAWKKYIG